MVNLIAPDLSDILRTLNKRIDKLEGAVYLIGTREDDTTTEGSLQISNLAGSIQYYTDVLGTVLARVTWSWNAPTSDSDDLQADIVSEYFISVTVAGSPNIAPYSRTTQTTVTISNLPIDTAVTCRVYASTSRGRTGPIELLTLNLQHDLTPPPQPSTPTVTSAIKSVLVKWNGKDVTNAAVPIDFSHIEIHTSTTPGFAISSATYFGKLYAAATVAVMTANYSTVYVRFVMYDKSGNAGPESTEASATPLKLVTTDIDVVLPGDIAYRDEGNLLIDGSFESAMVRDQRLLLPSSEISSFTFVNTAGIAAHGNYALAITGSATTSKYLYITNVNYNPSIVVGGTKLYISGKFRGISANGTCLVSLRFSDASNVFTFIQAITNTSSTGSYIFVESVITVPTDAVKFSCYVQTLNHTTGTWYVDAIQIRNVIGTMLIEDAAITTAKIEDLAVTDAKIETITAGKITTGVLAANQRIIAGNENDAHAELTYDGFTAYTYVDGDIVETVRFGTSNDNVLSIADPTTGETNAIIDSQGIATVNRLISREDPYALGYPLIGSQGASIFNIASFPNDAINTGRDLDTDPLGIIETYSKGLVAWCSYNATSFPQTITSGGEYALYELGFDVEPGRQYTIVVQPYLIDPAGAGTVGTRIRFTSDGTIPSLTSSVLAYDYHVTNTAGDLISTQVCGRLFNGSTSTQKYLRVLICAFATGTTATIYQSQSLMAYIVDLGPTKSVGGIVRNLLSGSSSSQTPIARTKTYTSTNYATYRGTGVKRTDTTDIVQGYSSLNGDGRGIWTFPSMTADLSGATINKIEIYCYATHWWYNAGGTAIIKVHNYASVPASNPTLTTALSKSGWKRGEGKWVTLPSSLYAGFQNGTYKGFGMGPSGGTNLEYYGRFVGPNTDATKAAKIRVTYTK